MADPKSASASVHEAGMWEARCSQCRYEVKGELTVGVQYGQQKTTRALPVSGGAGF